MNPLCGTQEKTPFMSYSKLYYIRGVFFMGTRAHYDPEIKWKAVKMKEDGYANSVIMDTLGIKNVSQIKTWMRWYRAGETHRFEQPVGKQYSFHKGIEELSEIEALKLRIKHLEMQNELLGKLKGISKN